MIWLKMLKKMNLKKWTIPHIKIKCTSYKIFKQTIIIKHSVPTKTRIKIKSPLKICTKMKFPITLTVNRSNLGVTWSMDLLQSQCIPKKTKIAPKDTQAQFTRTTMIVQTSLRTSIVIKQGSLSKQSSKVKITGTFKIFRSKKRSRKRNKLMSKWVIIKIKIRFITTRKLNTTIASFPSIWI